MKIDSHQHFWRYDRAQHAWITDAMSVLKRDFLPPDLNRELQASGIGASVAVQAAQSENETMSLSTWQSGMPPSPAWLAGWILVPMISPGGWNFSRATKSYAASGILCRMNPTIASCCESLLFEELAHCDSTDSPMTFLSTHGNCQRRSSWWRSFPTALRNRSHCQAPN